MASFNGVVIITLLLILNYSCDAYSTKGLKKNGGEERNYEVERVGGRKLKVKKEEEEIVSSCSTKKSSGANYVGKREMKMEKMMSSSVINHQHDDQTKNINPSGFMALNADYHMARPHPPRNN